MRYRISLAIFLALLVGGPGSRALAYESRLLTDVPNYDQDSFPGRNDCGPVAGAMLLGYWDLHGWPTMIGGSGPYYDSSHAPSPGLQHLVGTLKSIMPYDESNGTWDTASVAHYLLPFPVAGAMWQGVVNVAATQDDGAASWLGDDDDDISAEEIRNDIRAGRPVLLLVRLDGIDLINSPSRSSVQLHWMTIMGFEDRWDDEFFLAMRSGWIAGGQHTVWYNWSFWDDLYIVQIEPRGAPRSTFNSIPDMTYANMWRIDRNPRMTADVNGDGKADLVGIASDGVYVAFSGSAGFERHRRLTTSFAGWVPSVYPCAVDDVNGDGRSDVVGFGDVGTWVALSSGRTLRGAIRVTSSFGSSTAAGTWRTDRHVRALADVNGDGRKDIVGFGDNSVAVALSTSTATAPGFAGPTPWLSNFGYAQGWDVSEHPRLLGDVDGDGCADIVAFGPSGVLVSLSTGSNFLPPVLAVQNFGYSQSWRSSSHPRTIADVDGDGKLDVVGFGHYGVWVSRSRSSSGIVSFEPATMWLGEFGSAGGVWRVGDHPRILADANGDRRADVVAFGDAGVHVALSTGSQFAPSTQWSRNFGLAPGAGGWDATRYPRTLADVNGDGRADVVGFGDTSTYAAISHIRGRFQ